MKTKQILLACVIGLLPACKQQLNEPETLSKPANSASYTYDAPFDNTPVDSFMKHVPNIENVKFYIPRENNSRIYFETNSATGDIYKMTEEHDVAQTNTNILYPVVLNRTDNQSVDGTASFVSETTWNYTVSYQTPNNETRTWTIEDIPASLYNDYLSLSRAQMSDYVRISILERNPAATACADSVSANIYRGRSGVYTQNDPFTVQFNSKGAQQHLQHSDFGTITYTKGAVSETKMYSGANMDDAIHVLNCPATSMNATAFATVKRLGPSADEQQLLLNTGKNAARYVIDAVRNETIVMPFQNWYTVTIVRTANGNVYSHLTDSANVVPAQWQFIHTNNVENESWQGYLPNGISMTTGAYEFDEQNNGFETCFSANHFLEPSGNVEIVGQGYREDYVESGDRIVMTFCFGGTDRVQEDPVTTGLEMVYCAPQR